MHLHLQRSKLLTFPELCALICDKYYTVQNFQPPPGTLLCWRNKTLRDFPFFSFVSNLRFLLEWTHLKGKAVSECRMICRPSISSARMINTNGHDESCSFCLQNVFWSLRHLFIKTSSLASMLIFLLLEHSPCCNQRCLVLKVWELVWTLSGMRLWPHHS